MTGDDSPALEIVVTEEVVGTGLGLGLLNNAAGLLTGRLQVTDNLGAIGDFGVVKIWCERGFVGLKCRILPNKVRDAGHARTGPHSSDGHRAASATSNHDIRHLKNADGRQQEIVFVEVVEVRDGTYHRIATTAEWFQSEDVFNKLLASTCEFTADPPFQVSLCFVHGEHSVTRGSAPRIPDGGGYKVIQTDADIVDGIANYRGGFNWNGAVKDDPEHRAIRVFFDRQTVWVVAHEGIKEAFEISDVVFCPGQLEARPIQV